MCVDDCRVARQRGAVDESTPQPMLCQLCEPSPAHERPDGVTVLAVTGLGP